MKKDTGVDSTNKKDDTISTKPTEKIKKTTKQTKTFPSNNLEEALQVGKAIADNNAGKPWDSEQVAHAVNMSFKSTNFYYLTAASRDFGLTSGTSKSKMIELTSLGRKIFFPENSEQENEALITAFLNIDIFKKVYDHYNGGTLPERRFLFNTLQETFGLDSSFHEEFLKTYSECVSYTNSNVNNKHISVKTGNNKHAAKNNSTTDNSKSIFVIMPFNEKTEKFSKGFFDEVYNSLIVPAASEAGYTAFTANKAGSDIIHKTIVHNIFNAEIILADLTEHNPNVLFELGLAIAFKKKVAIIRAKGTNPIFDVDNSIRVLDYNPNLWKSTLDMDIEKISQLIQITLTSDETTYLDIFLGNS